MCINNLQIVDFGCILIAENGKKYRRLKVRDLTNNKIVDHVIFEKTNPSLWRDFLKYERTSRQNSLYNGKIVTHEGLDVLILASESAEYPADAED
jgi:predicted RNA methylase